MKRRSFLGSAVGAALGLLGVKPPKANIHKIATSVTSTHYAIQRPDVDALAEYFHKDLRDGWNVPFRIYNGDLIFPYIKKPQRSQFSRMYGTFVQWHNPRRDGKLPPDTIACHPSIASLMPNS